VSTDNAPAEEAVSTVKKPRPLIGWTAYGFAWVGAGVLGVMALLNLADVIGREVLSAPISANNEITQLLMGVLVYLSAGLTTRFRGHVRVDIVLNLLPSRARAVCDAITLAFCALFVAAMSWQLYERTIVKLVKDDQTDLARIPTWPFAAVMTVCAALMALLLFIQWFGALKHAVTGVPETDDGNTSGGL